MPDPTATTEQVEAMCQDVTDLVERMRKVYPNPSHAMSVMANALGIIAAHAAFRDEAGKPIIPTYASVAATVCRFHSIAMQSAIHDYEDQLRAVVAGLIKDRKQA